MSRGVLRAIGAVVVIAGCWVAMIFLGTDILNAVRPRFEDPTGDHPPYSRLQLEVKPGVANVLYGGQLEVQVVVRGAPAEKFFVATRTKNHPTTQTPMFRAPDGTFFQTLANLREPVEYFVTDGRARSKRFPVNIRYTPEINSVELEAVFPSYTSLPSRNIHWAEQEQSFPVGTRVNFRAFSNRPLQSGTLTLTPLHGGKEQTLTLSNAAAGAATVAGDFELNEPVEFKIAVRDVDGIACQETRQGRLGVIPDKPPQLHVIQPERRAVAPVDFSIPVYVQARDDYGVSRVVWFRGLNNPSNDPSACRWN